MAVPIELNVNYWNAQSICIRSKAVEYFNYINDNNVHIGIITESWLKSKHIFNDPNFICYRSDRSGRAGGVAVVINNKIEHTPLPALKTRSIETVAIELFTARGTIVVIGAYFP